jgi:hypothetical protein
VALVSEPILPEAHVRRRSKVVSRRNRRRVAATDKEAHMALARVVTFDGVSKDRAAELQRQIGQGERPEGLPATEIILLHVPEAEKALAIVFFDSEDDYQQGDRTLSAMPAGDTPGQRTSVTKYDVSVRRSN